ncbi:hypothetical protein QUB76_37625, partial [Microcoleus sp. D2B6]|uniref:hypothetical protein n=1 Tax=unclassified Microcoleus TaxID=2642155 RepID=UPI002FCFCA40
CCIESAAFICVHLRYLQLSAVKNPKTSILDFRLRDICEILDLRFNGTLLHRICCLYLRSSALSAIICG